MTALMWAIRWGSVEVVNMLIHAHADVNMAANVSGCCICNVDIRVGADALYVRSYWYGVVYISIL